MATGDNKVTRSRADRLTKGIIVGCVVKRSLLHRHTGKQTKSSQTKKSHQFNIYLWSCKWTWHWLDRLLVNICWINFHFAEWPLRALISISTQWMSEQTFGIDHPSNRLSFSSFVFCVLALHEDEIVWKVTTKTGTGDFIVKHPKQIHWPKSINRMKCIYY